jgi:hypothetical protein
MSVPLLSPTHAGNLKKEAGFVSWNNQAVWISTTAGGAGIHKRSGAYGLPVLSTLRPIQADQPNSTFFLFYLITYTKQDMHTKFQLENLKGTDQESTRG